ncbi:MAG: hypothetical protein AB7G44_03585 [Bacteroidia bacterium]
MRQWLQKNKEILILGLVFLLAFLVTFFFIEKKESYYSYIFLYMLIGILSTLLPDGKILTPVKIIIGIPGIIVLLIGPLVEAIYFIIFAFIIPFAIIALALKILPEYVLQIDLNFPAKLYLLLILLSVFTTSFSEKIMHLINNGINRSKSPERKKSQIELALGLANKDRIRFVIFFSFFIYLIIFSVSKLNRYEIFEISSVDQAVFYAFTTYVAFDRFIHSLNLLNFKPREFFIKLINAWDALGYFKGK